MQSPLESWFALVCGLETEAVCSSGDNARQEQPKLEPPCAEQTWETLNSALRKAKRGSGHSQDLVYLPGKPSDQTVDCY